MSEFVFHEFAPLLPAKLLERAAKLSPAQLCDGMKGLGIPCDGCAPAEILPVARGMKVLGTAYTIRSAGGNNFPVHVALYDPRVTPGYVMVIAGQAATERCYMGDLIASTAKAIGLEGIVVDGYVRDREGISTMGYPVFARGFLQRGPSKIEAGEINGEVRLGDLPVKPGDLVMGDDDGITVVPRERLEEVLDAAEKKQAYEEKRRISIAEYERCRLAGEARPQLAPQWVLDMQKG